MQNQLPKINKNTIGAFMERLSDEKLRIEQRIIEEIKAIQWVRTSPGLIGRMRGFLIVKSNNGKTIHVDSCGIMLPEIIANVNDGEISMAQTHLMRPLRAYAEIYEMVKAEIEREDEANEIAHACQAINENNAAPRKSMRI